MLYTKMVGRSARPRSPSTPSTAACCSSACAWLMSTTWSRISASCTSSSVAWKAATNWWGRAPAYWLPYFGSASITASVAKAKELEVNDAL